MDSRTDCLQGTLTETIGIALADLRQPDPPEPVSRLMGSSEPVLARLAPSLAQRHPPPYGSFRHPISDRRGRP